MSAALGKDAASPRQRERILRILAGGPATVDAAAKEDRVLLVAGERGTHAISKSVLINLARDDLVIRNGDKLALSDAGRSALSRSAADGAGFAQQHQHRSEKQVDIDGARQTVVANMGESPLGLLARRKDRQGRPFLTGAEIQAGERLRSDYTRGRIMPRLGANWQASVSSGVRDGGSGGGVDLTDAALSARQRVDNAIASVGPELAGVLIDVCCFLKGLERLEMERGWPVRSAKIVLKTALAALSRHYEPASASARRRDLIVHWGAENYRPTLNGGYQPG